MKKVLTISLLLLLGFAGQSQTPDCQRFKDGSFYYPDLPGGLSVRKGNMQRSIHNGKLQMVWKVDWLDDCTYEMECKGVVPTDEDFPMKVGDRIIATIIETDEECYLTEIVIYNEESPEGEKVPNGIMCRQKDSDQLNKTPSKTN